MTYKNYADLPLALTVKQVSGQIKSIRAGHQYRITKTALRDYLERSAA